MSRDFHYPKRLHPSRKEAYTGFWKTYCVALEVWVTTGRPYRPSKKRLSDQRYLKGYHSVPFRRLRLSRH